MYKIEAAHVEVNIAFSMVSYIHST
jgi:hypothetical protein